VKLLLLATFQTWVTTPPLPSNNSFEPIMKTTLGKLMMTKLGASGVQGGPGLSPWRSGSAWAGFPDCHMAVMLL